MASVQELGEPTAQDIAKAFDLDGDDQFTPLHDEADKPAVEQPEPVTDSPEPMHEVKGSWAAAEAYKVRQITFDRLWLEAPTGEDLFAFGEPREWQPDGQGSVFLVTRNDVIKAYAEICIRCNSSRPLTGPDILAALSLEDARKVRTAILDFFTLKQA